MDVVTGLLSMEEQIAKLRADLANYQKPQPRESVEDVVRRVLSEHGAITPPPVTTPQVDNTVSYGESLLLAIGSALSKDQQEWLSHEVNQAGIPAFLNTYEGQAITRRFIDMYQAYKGVK